MVAIDFEKLTGVYLIRNTVNGKVYVGSASRSIGKRWWQHRWNLSRNPKAKKSRLLNAWKKYGADAFVFEVLIVCEPQDCLRYEQWYIDHFKSADQRFGYNQSPTAGNILGMKQSPETCAKLAAIFKGRTFKPETLQKMRLAHKNRSPEHCAKISRSKRGKKIGPLSESHKAKLSAVHKGRKFSAETLARMSDAKKKTGAENAARLAAINTGRPLSPEHRLKLSLATKGRKRPPRTPEHSARISAAKKGTKLSAEHRAKLSAIRKGRKLSEECKAKLRAKALLRPGTPWTEEHRAKVMAGHARRRARKALVERARA